MAVIDAAKGAGVEKVGIVTEGMRRAAGVGGNIEGLRAGQQVVEPRLRVDGRVDDHLAAQGHPRRFF